MTFLRQLYDLVSFILVGVVSRFKQGAFWFRNAFNFRILSFLTIANVILYAVHWVADTLWNWVSGVFVSFLEGLGLSTPEGLSATGLTGWFVDLFALDVVGSIIVNYFLLIASARFLLYIAFCVKQLTRIIP